MELHGIDCSFTFLHMTTYSVPNSHEWLNDYTWHGIFSVYPRSQTTESSAQSAITEGNHAHARHKLYPMKCDLCWDFTRPKSEWDMTCMFHGSGFLLLYHIHYFTPSPSLWIIQVISNTPICHQTCKIWGIKSWKIPPPPLPPRIKSCKH